MNDISDITIPEFHMEKILKSKIVDKELINQHLDIDDPQISLYKETSSPKLKVIFYRLESASSGQNSNSDRVSFPINKDSRIEMVIPSETGTPKNFKVEPIKTAMLWDLSQFNKVDILRCGRFKKNDFHPIISEEPLEMDLGVSREHSLICLFNNQVYYIDFGTSKKYLSDEDIPEQEKNGSHFGSKNGSWLYKDYNIEKCIKNECMEWCQEDLVGIGTFFYNVTYQNKKLKLFHQFTFQHERLD